MSTSLNCRTQGTSTAQKPPGGARGPGGEDSLPRGLDDDGVGSVDPTSLGLGAVVGRKGGARELPLPTVQKLQSDLPLQSSPATVA